MRPGSNGGWPAMPARPAWGGWSVDFGEPIGEGDTIHTPRSKVRTFGESFGGREAGFRLSLAPAVLEHVRDLVGASEERIAEVARSASPPSPHTVSVQLVDAFAGDRAVGVRSLTTPHGEWGLGDGIVSTATPAAAAVALLARGGIEARGALPSESCIDADEMFAELEPRGVEVTIESGPRREVPA